MENNRFSEEKIKATAVPRRRAGKNSKIVIIEKAAPIIKKNPMIKIDFKTAHRHADTYISLLFMGNIKENFLNSLSNRKLLLE